MGLIVLRDSKVEPIADRRLAGYSQPHSVSLVNAVSKERIPNRRKIDLEKSLDAAHFVAYSLAAVFTLGEAASGLLEMLKPYDQEHRIPRAKHADTSAGDNRQDWMSFSRYCR